MTIESTYTELQLIAQIRNRVSGSTQKQIALDLDISLQYLNGILSGERGVSDHVAKMLGFDKKWVYMRKEA